MGALAIIPRSWGKPIRAYLGNIAIYKPTIDTYVYVSIRISLYMYIYVYIYMYIYVYIYRYDCISGKYSYIQTNYRYIDI